MIDVQLGGQMVAVQVYNTTLGGVRSLVEADLAVDVDARAAKAANGSDFEDREAATGNLLFLQSGTGAESRSVRTKLRDIINLKDFGAVGDGVTDDAPAIRAALAAAVGREVVASTPAVAYRCASSLGAIGNVQLRGDGKRTCLFRKDYSDGDPFLTLNDGADLEGVRIDLNGGVHTGPGVFVPDGEGNQTIRSTAIINGDEYCLFFEKDGGPGFASFNLEAYCYDSTVAAVQIEDALATDGRPRSFVDIRTAGNKSFSTGGANNLFIVNSTLFDIDFSTNSRDVAICNSRLAGVSGYTLRGSGSIMGGGVAPNITIASGAVWNVNPAYSNNEIFDESGGASIVNQHKIQTYTPEIAAGGTAITLGSGGSITGRYSRAGKLVTMKVRVLLGTGPTVPAGQLSVELPIPTAADLLQTGVSGRLTDSSGNFYRIDGVINAGASVALLERDTTGSVTASAPGTLGDGSGFWVQATYET